MSNFIKPIWALAISFLVFSGYIILAEADLFELIQTRFYNPSIINHYVKENNIDAQLAQDFILGMQNRFTAILRERSVRNSFLYTQSAEDIFERSRAFGILLEITRGLQSVQFIDSNGIRIHYSTAARDIISQSSESAAYRNYREDPLALPYDIVCVLDGNSAKFTLDEKSDRIIFSYPFYDSMNVYRGTALFNVSIKMAAERLIAERRLKVSEDISIITEPPGILIGSPEVSKTDIHSKVSEIWRLNFQKRVTLQSEDSGASFSLITSKAENGLYFGRLINDSLFFISDSMRFILQLSIFLTFYLTFFLLLNLRQNPVTVLKNRIKNLREELFEQLYVKKTSQERTGWILELEQRREEIRKGLKQHLIIRRSLKPAVDEIIDKSWDELLAVLKSGSAYSFHAGIPQTAAKTETLEEIDEVEEIEDAGAAEEIDVIEDSKFEKHAKGLLRLASEFNNQRKDTDTPIQLSGGLLKKASEIKAREKKSPQTTASEDKHSQKGLPALASEIEFSHNKYPVAEEQKDEDDFPVELDIDIVSPFSSMFSSLDTDKDENWIQPDVNNR